MLVAQLPKEALIGKEVEDLFARASLFHVVEKVVVEFVSKHNRLHSKLNRLHSQINRLYSTVVVS